MRFAYHKNLFLFDCIINLYISFVRFVHCFARVCTTTGYDIYRFALLAVWSRHSFRQGLFWRIADFIHLKHWTFYAIVLLENLLSLLSSHLFLRISPGSKFVVYIWSNVITYWQCLDISTYFFFSIVSVPVLHID